MKTNGKIQLAPLARVVVPMMVGITVADTLDLPVVWWLLPLILILLLAFFVSRRPITQTVLVLLAFFFLGGMLLSIQLQQNRPELPQQDFLFEGVIVNEPVEKNKVIQKELAKQKVADLAKDGWYIVAVLGVNEEPTNHAIRDIAAVKADFEESGVPLLLTFPDKDALNKFRLQDFRLRH